jgi:hypothetical protein
MWKYGISLAVLATIGFLTSTGCGGGPSMSKVEGIVTLDGKPVNGATVMFEPETKGCRQASGRSGEDGVFHLTTFNTNDGAQAGTYKIVVTKTEEMSGFQADPNDPQTMNKMIDKMKMTMKNSPGAAKAKGAHKSPIPEQYTKADKTPLKCTVPHNGRVEVAMTSSKG